MSQDYPDDWDSRRKEVYRRDDYTCQNCGNSGGPHGDTELHAHHIVPKSRGGTHKLTNLTTLCDQCHNDAHSWDISSNNSPNINNQINQVEDSRFDNSHSSNLKDTKEELETELDANKSEKEYESEAKNTEKQIDLHDQNKSDLVKLPITSFRQLISHVMKWSLITGVLITVVLGILNYIINSAAGVIFGIDLMQYTLYELLIIGIWLFIFSVVMMTLLKEEILPMVEY